jgi:hypothetical protein
MKDSEVSTEGWRNRWDAAIEIAANASAKYHDIAKELDEYKIRLLDSDQDRRHTLKQLLNVLNERSSVFTLCEELRDALQDVKVVWGDGYKPNEVPSETARMNTVLAKAKEMLKRY